MADYSFMKTGADNVDGSSVAAGLIGQAELIMRVWAEDVAESAARFAAACGRSTVTARDMQLAAKHQAQAFLSTDESTNEVLRRVLEHRNTDDAGEEGGEEGGEEDGDEDEEDGSSEEEEASGEMTDDDEQGEYSTTFAVGDDAARLFHANVLQAEAGWGGWRPDDPVRQLIKAAVDSAEVGMA